jgi:excinuclease ABC subunit C
LGITLPPLVEFELSEIKIIIEIVTSQEFKTILEKLPDAPGVYFFIGPPKHSDAKATLGREILYIGKATSLRDRVRSYFGPDLIQTRGRLLVDMVSLADTIDFTQTDSVLEALLLEANLIKTHHPKYNTKEKDNKSYNYVVFTNEDFPKILTIRGRTLLMDDEKVGGKKKYKYIFGPFPHGAQLKEAMKIIRRIFPYSDDKCTSCEEQMKKYHPGLSATPPNLGGDASLRAGEVRCRPCFNRQIGLCPGVCTGEISKQDYAEHISNLKLFFEGKKKALLRNLEKQMSDYADKQEFEKAGEISKTIFALNHIQDIALLKSENKIVSESAGGLVTDSDHAFRIEAYDVAHSSGKHVVGVMTVVEDGEPKKSDYRKFKIKLNPGVNDTAALKEILRRRLGHLEWSMPDLIVVDGAQAQLNVAMEVLKERGLNINLVSVVKDERHKPRDIMGDQKLAESYKNLIILANSEAHRFAVSYHRNRRDRIV